MSDLFTFSAIRYCKTLEPMLYCYYNFQKKRDPIMQEICGQICSIVATVIITSAYQANTKRGLLMIQTPGVVLLCLSYLLLGAYRMYLNHAGTGVSLSGYDLLREAHFTEIPAYGVALVKE